MKKILINKDTFQTYKEFYPYIYNKLNGSRFLDWEDFPDLNCNPNMLNEFLWYNHNDSLKFMLYNFDLDKITAQKTYDNYEWNIILEVLQQFTTEYPNNTLEFVNDNNNN